MEILDKVVGPLTVAQWGLVLIGIVVAFGILNLLTGRGRSSGSDKLSAAKCLGCGWNGQVSKYHRTCPKCGNSITRLEREET